ncbi:MAG: hypothetical protein HW380_609 [Magnetococcales bacterium]|nr:hypothetical protein [Magnetococcales bacterium]
MARPPGLSPQARGNLTSFSGTPMNPGSIPAGAGEPVPLADDPAAIKVYPRRRGGTPTWPLPFLPKSGLSPQARGNPTKSIMTALGAGSIPAGAGEPIPLQKSQDLIRVYPRRRGGTILISPIPATSRGLSPQARGNHKRTVLQCHNNRSIPAGAGEPA